MKTSKNENGNEDAVEVRFSALGRTDGKTTPMSRAPISEDLKTPNPEHSLNTALGITDSRNNELTDKIKSAMREEGTKTKSMLKLWNDESMTDAEVAYALFSMGYNSGAMEQGIGALLGRR